MTLNLYKQKKNITSNNKDINDLNILGWLIYPFKIYVEFIHQWIQKELLNLKHDKKAKTDFI